MADQVLIGNLRGAHARENAQLVRQLASIGQTEAMIALISDQIKAEEAKK